MHRDKTARKDELDLDIMSRFLDDQGKPQLRECNVLSLDLLGTRSETNEQAAQFLQLTDSALSRAQSESGTDRPRLGVVVRWFTDNVAIATLNHGVDSMGLSFDIRTAAHLQAELAIQGLLSRGGLALGDFFANETLLYGPALIEAHNLEDKIAVYPRIVLSEKISTLALQQLKRHELLGGWHRDFIALDGDGTPFVNYLSAFNSNDPEDSRTALSDHRDVICKGLDQAKGASVLQKYRWAANYHDRFCRTFYWAKGLETGRYPERLDKLVRFGALDETPTSNNGGLAL